MPVGIPDKVGFQDGLIVLSSKNRMEVLDESDRLSLLFSHNVHSGTRLLAAGSDWSLGSEFFRQSGRARMDEDVIKIRIARGGLTADRLEQVNALLDLKNTPLERDAAGLFVQISETQRGLLQKTSAHEPLRLFATSAELAAASDFIKSGNWVDAAGIVQARPSPPVPAQPGRPAPITSYQPWHDVIGEVLINASRAVSVQRYENGRPVSGPPLTGLKAIDHVVATFGNGSFRSVLLAPRQALQPLSEASRQRLVTALFQASETSELRYQKLAENLRKSQARASDRSSNPSR